MKYWYLLVVFALGWPDARGQLSRDAISTDFVLYQRRIDFERNMRERTINAVFAQPLDSNSEDRYREACWAISQFLLRSAQIEKGFHNIFTKYASLEDATKSAWLEAVYGSYPAEYTKEMKQLLPKETNARLFARQAVYLFRIDHGPANTNYLRRSLRRQFEGFQNDMVLAELDNYLQHHYRDVAGKTPSITALFKQQQQSGQKMIYSFQRWNRDQPGLAIIQQADGSFSRDTSGRLLVFEQLARSASDLPYFITNGSTPQGIYSIQGSEVSRNKLIGPTPNIQLVMPNETDSVFWHTPYDSTKDALANYLLLLPASWRNYRPITESFIAGKAGRTEIIAHGTTIDPELYKGKPFYPFTPTMGCLCAKETWNIFTGKLLQSEQFNLANTFLSTPGDKGYLMVINLDNQQKPVSRNEIEWLVREYERDR